MCCTHTVARVCEAAGLHVFMEDFFPVFSQSMSRCLCEATHREHEVLEGSD